MRIIITNFLIFLCGCFFLPISANTLFVSNTNDSGMGSLRDVVAMSNSGDSIRFLPGLLTSGNDTIFLTSGEIHVVDKELTFIGLMTPSDTLFVSGSKLSRIFYFEGVNTDVTVRLDSMALTEGLSSSDYGGAVKVYSNFRSVKLILNHSLISKSFANRGGGAACYIGGYSSSLPTYSYATVKIDNSIIFRNAANSSGGGIHVSTGGNTTPNRTRVYLTNSLIHGNNSDYDGGGLYILKADTVIVNTSDFIKNTSGDSITSLLSQGGGLYVKEATKVIVENCDFQYNTARSAGGGMSILGDTAVLMKNSFRYNYAGSGGGANTTGITFVDSCQFNYNIARGGGAIGGNNFLIKNSDLSENKASVGNGGAINVFWGSLVNCRVTNNSSQKNGGGVSLNAGNIINTTISGNTAQEMGGGLYVSVHNDSLSIENCLIEQNRSVAGGGGMCLLLRVSGSADTVVAQISKSFVLNNSSDREGGGLYISWGGQAFLNIDSSEIYNNDSQLQGGGVYTKSTSTTGVNSKLITSLNHSTIALNRTLNRGGGIYSLVSPLSTYSVNKINSYNSTFYLNQDNHSGGAIICSSCSINLENTTIYDTSNISPGIMPISNGAGPSGITLKSSILVSKGIGQKWYLTSLGYNIFSGSIVNPTASDRMNVDTNTLKLGAFQLYGGITRTLRPKLGSIAINGGTPNDLRPAQDTIVFFGRRDVGASEYVLGGNIDTLVNIVACDSLVDNNGYTWINNGGYLDTLVSQTSNDSVVLYNVNVIRTQYNYLVPIWRCDSVEVFGSWYYSSQTVYDTLSSQITGCDSILVQDVIIGHPSMNLLPDLIVCDSSFLYGEWFYTSQTIYDTLISYTGCDSILELNLIVNHSKYTQLNDIVACDSANVFGNWYYSSQLVTDTLTTIAGCDSVISVNLIINTTLHLVMPQIVVCDSVEVFGSWYYSSQTVYDTLSSQITGCDSILVQDVIIGHPSMNLLPDLIVCDSSFLYGEWFYTSQTIYDTLISYTGCDSILELNLIVNHSKYTQLNDIVACDSANAFGNWYYSSQLVMDTLTTTAGCDSIISVNLIVNHSEIVFLPNLSSCDSVQLYGNWYTSSQIVYDTLFKVFSGCDSILATELEIHETPDVSVSINGVTISSLVSTGVSYQWVDCLNGNSWITGASSQSYTAVANGEYSVIIDNGYCLDTSECVVINSVGIEAALLSDDFKIYPNPLTNQLNIFSLNKIEFIKIYNSLGELMMIDSNKTQLDVSRLESGVYMCVIQINGNQTKAKLIIQR